MQFGTPNYAAHGGFCSVNMAAAGLYTFGGSFWEFGDTDWDHTRYFLLFGVAEDHASNPIKIGARQAQEARRQGRVGQSGAHRLQRHRRRVDRHQARHRRPVRGALIHELLQTQTIDVDYLVRYTNAPWLVIRDPGAADDGLFARDADGNPLGVRQGVGQAGRAR